MVYVEVTNTKEFRKHIRIGSFKDKHIGDDLYKIYQEPQKTVSNIRPEARVSRNWK